MTVHTRDGIFQYNAYLKEAAKQLNSFFLCHRAVLVNPFHIRFLQKNPCKIILDNGSSCPCSFRQYQKLNLYLEQQQSKKIKAVP
ncbi:LytTR family DNA-binding domain-containing protein [Eisenbergiella sp.]